MKFSDDSSKNVFFFFLVVFFVSVSAFFAAVSFDAGHAVYANFFAADVVRASDVEVAVVDAGARHAVVCNDVVRDVCHDVAVVVPSVHSQVPVCDVSVAGTHDVVHACNVQSHVTPGMSRGWRVV